MRDYAVRLGTRDEKRQGFPGGYRNVTPRPRPRSGRARHGGRRPGGARTGRGAFRPGQGHRRCYRRGPAARAAWPPAPPAPPGYPWRPRRLATRPDQLPVAPPVRALPRLAPLHGVRRPVAPVPVAPGRPHHGQPRAAGALPRGCPACRLRTCHALPPPGSGRPVCRRDPGSSGGGARGRRTRTRPVRSGAYGWSGRRLRRAGGHASRKVNAEARVVGPSPVVTA